MEEGGKEILIKAVAQVAPTYAMGIFKIPKGTTMDINKIIAIFFGVDRKTIV